MVQIAIKGHAIRHKEVIEILKMLGGKNKEGHCGYNPNVAYYISHQNTIVCDCDCDCYTLEEFLEKYPYKVGDKVTVTGLPEYPKIINFMEWFDGDIHYSFDNETWFLPSALQPYKEEAMEEKDIIKPTTEINLNHPCFDGRNEIELIIPEGWAFEQRDGKMFGVRKQYPKTYAECCRIIVAKQDRHYYYTKKDKEQDYPNEIRILDQLDHLRMLIICRDAYWKITGEQMGLGKLWEPNWSDPDEKKYCIVITTEGDIKKCIQKITHKILTFPTEEMRDAFYENFKSLIESCKELL